MKKARTIEKVEEIVNNLGYELLNSYIGKHNKTRVIIQDKIGYKYDSSLENLICGKIPYFVSINNPYGLENIILWLKLNKSDFELCLNNIYKGNNKKLKFYHIKCKEISEIRWYSIINGRGCPVCAGYQVGKYNTLGYLFPNIAEEWHPIKNGNLTPNDKTFGSHTKVWWLCPEGHEYFSSIGERTGKDKCGCKQCANEQQESKIASQLKKYFISNHNAKDEYNIVRNPKTNAWLWYDIYIPRGVNPKINGVYIEVNGGQHTKIVPLWHKTPDDFEDSKYRDKIKKQFAKKHGIYIEIDLRKIKTVEEAIKYIENIISKHQ